MEEGCETLLWLSPTAVEVCTTVFFSEVLVAVSWGPSNVDT
jgi:hypothetical protein